MTLRTQRNGPLRTANYPTTPNGPAQPMSNKTALSGSGSIGQAAKTKMLTSSSNSSAKSAKICVNFNNMLADGAPNDKNNSRTTITLQPNPANKLYTARRGNGDKGDDDEDGDEDSDDNDYLYRPTRLSGGKH